MDEAKTAVYDTAVVWMSLVEARSLDATFGTNAFVPGVALGLDGGRGRKHN